MVSVWTTQLSVAALPALLRTFLRHGRFTLRFTTTTWGGRSLSWLLNALGILVSPAEQIEFTGHGARVDNVEGGYLYFQTGTNEFTTRFVSTHRELLGELTYPNPRVRPDRVLTSLRKSILQATYDLLLFVEFARYRHRVDGIPINRLIVLSPKAVLANTVPPGWAGDDVAFDYLWSPNNSLLAWMGRSILKCMTEAVRCPQRQMVGPTSVGVVSAWGLDRSARLNDLFWWWDSGISATRVVLFFDRQDSPASREAVAYAEQLGVRCAVLNRLAVGDSPHLLWRASPGLLASLGRLGRKLKQFCWGLRRGMVGRWITCRVLQLLYYGEQIEDFLEEFNIKAICHYQDTDFDYVSIACDAAGAARIGYFWSYLPWPMADQVRLHQVCFVWGPQAARILGATSSCVDHVLLSGCIIREAYVGDGNKMDSGQLHNHVNSHGASRVLALFDTSFPCEGFYEFFLSRILEDPRWALLIKPKSITGLPWVQHSLPKLQDLYERAIAAGRVKVLDWKVSPAEAAAAADFSVGVGINTATVVAALAGYRAIHLDYVRLHESQHSAWASFYKAGPNRLVFDDPELLWKKLNHYFDSPGSDPSLGVMDECLLQELDPFRDGQASRRIGEYIRLYLEGLDCGLGRDGALQAADLQYGEKWGSESVVQRPT